MNAVLVLVVLMVVLKVQVPVHVVVMSLLVPASVLVWAVCGGGDW